MIWSMKRTFGCLAIAAALMVGSVACNSCYDKGGVHVADDRLDEPGPDVRAAYDTVHRAVSKVGRYGVAKGTTIAHVPVHIVACEVDDDLRVHVLRLPEVPEPHTPGFGSGVP